MSKRPARVFTIRHHDHERTMKRSVHPDSTSIETKSGNDAST
ncbi:hypothetical protein BURMUCGD2M_2405 [Burkholderia multivorans CGD2M]|uniref:Uncharacterized protein n=1 Tax=Burkholderia multivorans CGD2 TaxID=513052 RepID=B9BN91_9BURK|nr:hypothetical protein BURMUCGD2_2318 [Burkholderia multivorans CGD2]EEE10549.1 hypothetical protein BURMUCGD2M_2405 [Burkholderia multivorans CGD2M]